MRPSKDTATSQFTEIFKTKQEEWLEKNPPPTPPTAKNIKEDIANGRIHIDERCGCRIKENLSYDYSSPDREDVLPHNLFRVACVESFLKKAKAYHKKKDSFFRTLRAVRNEAQNDVLYAKANFNEALDKLRAVKI